MAPLISILIPTFNRSSIVCRAIESALALPYPNKEVLVSDNGSVDGTYQMLVDKFGDEIHLFHHKETMPMASHWRYLLEQANGEYFLLLSDDDYLVADANVSFELQQALMSNANLGVVFMATAYEDQSKVVGRFNALVNDELMRKPPSNKVLLLEYGNSKKQPLSAYAIGSTLFSVRKAKEMNAFLEKDNIGCDTKLFMDMISFFDVKFISGVMSVYNTHGDNLIGKYKRNYALLSGTAFCRSDPIVAALSARLIEAKELSGGEAWRAAQNFIIDFLEVSSSDFKGRSKESASLVFSKIPYDVFGWRCAKLWVHSSIVWLSPSVYMALRKVYVKIRGKLLGH